MDWQEAYHNFDPMEPLKPGDPRLHQGLFGDFLNTVINRLLLNRNKNQKLLLSGHLGCGKSTFLNLLQEHQEIKDNFFTVKYSIKDILDPNDADHIDLLLSLTLQSAIAAQEGGISIDEVLSRKLEEHARELQGLIQRETEKVKKKGREMGIGVKAGLNLTSLILWFKTDFFDRYKYETETRNSIRSHYKPRITDFINTIRDILDRIQASLENKSLLILIDDTDKIPTEQALKIFFDNGQYLATPPANIVFMVDTSVSCSSKYSAIRAKIGGEEFFPAIKVLERDASSSSITESNRKILRELVLRRMRKELIEDNALQEAIKMSGGVVRELILILNEAIFNARGKVQKDHVNHSVIRIRNSYNLFGHHVRILKEVLKDPNWFHTNTVTEETTSTFLELLHMPALFQYRDGEDKWYRPYPIFIPWLEKLS